jgi:hypothetical protein
MYSRSLIVAAMMFVIALTMTTAAHAASDVITLDTVNATSTSVDVPIYIRDVSGTPLGVDQPAGSRIQSLSIKINFPAASIDSVSIARAGVTASLTPAFETTPSTSNSIALLVTFQEATNLIPFSVNAPAPGNLIARLTVHLKTPMTPNSSIALSIDPSVAQTQLADSAGSGATKETVGNGLLSVVDGAIHIPALSVSLNPSSKNVTTGASRSLSANINLPVGSDTTVNLSSSDTTVASVPATVTIPAGATVASFSVSGNAAGSAVITGSISGSSDTSNITVADQSVQCDGPVAPLVSAPSTADPNSEYAVSWNAGDHATEYVVEESQQEDFSSIYSQTTTSTSVIFHHDTPGTRYYYRVHARNHTESCDLTSDASTKVSVMIDAGPFSETRILPVVGSVPGGFGSHFKTSLQLFNAGDTAISGKVVVHLAGASGASTDPSLAYSLPPLKSVHYDDLLPAVGISSGIGSADIVTDLGSAAPVALARVYNDAGVDGTTGLGEDAMELSEALEVGERGALIAPDDVTRFRMNVGVRTLADGATISVTIRDQDGVTKKNITKSFEATFFAQTSLSDFVEGYALTGGETISFEVVSGSAFIYGATTDNTTNDPSVQFARSAH